MIQPEVVDMKKNSRKLNHSSNKGFRHLTIDDFFYVECEDYDELIEASIPYYKLLHEELLKCLPVDKSRPLRILDLGVGTGKTLGYLLNSFPNAQGVGVDLFSSMLDRAKVNLSDYTNQIEFIQRDMREVNFEPSSFDIVISVLAIHHLADVEKKEVFSSIQKWLAPGGVFMLGDWISFDDPHLVDIANTIANKHVTEMAENKQIPKKAADDWIAHWRNVNLPATVDEQLSWMKQIGFSYASCIFQYYGIALMMARK